MWFATLVKILLFELILLIWAIAAIASPGWALLFAAVVAILLVHTDTISDWNNHADNDR